MPRPLMVGCWPEIAWPRGESKSWHGQQQHDTSKRRQNLGSGVQVTHRSSSLEAVREAKVCGLWSQGTCLSVPLHLLAVVVSDDQDQFMETSREPEPYWGEWGVHKRLYLLPVWQSLEI